MPTAESLTPLVPIYQKSYNADLPRVFMSPAPDDLCSLKDDMIAFIEGHGMRRFHGYVDYEEVPSVMWKSEDNPDSWKDFVELARSEEHTSELQSQFHLVCRLLLEKKKKKK